MGKTLQTLPKVIFYLLLLFLPSQFGLHFWPTWSIINGVRVDYFAPTLYFTDFFVISIFLLNLPKIINDQLSMINKLSISKLLNFKFVIYFFIALFVYLNITSSLSPFVSLYKWLKVAEFAYLGLVIYKSNHLPRATGHLLLIPIFYSSVLAIWQFINQSSVGGLWYFLGERAFNASTPGIANAYIGGQLVLRPYATFPHPNVLGGFLAVVLPLVLTLQFRSEQTQFPHNSRRITVPVLTFWLTIILGYIALFLSLSRAAILVGLTCTAIVLWSRSTLKKYRLFLIFITLIPLIILWPRFTALKLETEPIIAREQLNNLAVKEWVKSPLVGSGLGTSPLYKIQNTRYKIQNYALVYQPVHNIYLLLLSETGIVGLGVFGALGVLGVRNLWRRRNYILLASLLSILILGLVDHYWLTLQQGQLVLVILFGLSLSGLRTVWK